MAFNVPNGRALRSDRWRRPRRSRAGLNGPSTALSTGNLAAIAGAPAGTSHYYCVTYFPPSGH